MQVLVQYLGVNPDTNKRIWEIEAIPPVPGKYGALQVQEINRQYQPVGYHDLRFKITVYEL
jgi:hypothetical protein